MAQPGNKRSHVVGNHLFATDYRCAAPPAIAGRCSPANRYREKTPSNSYGGVGSAARPINHNNGFPESRASSERALAGNHGVGAAVEQMRSRRQMHFASDQSEWPVRPPPRRFCRALKVRLKQSPLCRETRLLAVRSLVSPAPRLMTRRPERSPKVFPASSTATAPTDVAPLVI